MAFQLPANWYTDTIAELVGQELPTKFGPLTKENAWKYVVACVMWAEKVSGAEGLYPHLNARLRSAAGRALAKRGEDYLNEHFATGGNTLAEIDAIGKLYAAE